jgi:hypothetical protein
MNFEILVWVHVTSSVEMIIFQRITLTIKKILNRYQLLKTYQWISCAITYILQIMFLQFENKTCRMMTLLEEEISGN